MKKIFCDRCKEEIDLSEKACYSLRFKGSDHDEDLCESCFDKYAIFMSNKPIG